MKTLKTSEAHTIAASTDEGRERRARELEELAQKRLMRAYMLSRLRKEESRIRVRMQSII